MKAINNLKWKTSFWYRYALHFENIIFVDMKNSNSYLCYYFISIEWSHSANVKITVSTENPVNRPKFPPTELTKSKNVYNLISSVSSISVFRKDIMVENVLVLLGNERFIACLNFWLIFSEMMPLESYSVDCIL